MTQEEKARAYDEAYKRVVIRFGSNVADEIFPELKESEDERIRKEILNYIIKGSESLYDVQQYGKERFEKWIAWVEKQGEQKHAIEMKSAEESLGISSDTYNKIVDECIYGEHKPAWSEEDEYYLNSCITKIEIDIQNWEGHGKTMIDVDKEIISWLKSIRHRNTWKPSEEQMNALNYVVNLMASSERPTENDLYYNILKSLRQQLKKLKE